MGDTKRKRSRTKPLAKASKIGGKEERGRKGLKSKFEFNQLKLIKKNMDEREQNELLISKLLLFLD